MPVAAPAVDAALAAAVDLARAAALEEAGADFAGEAGGRPPVGEHLGVEPERGDRVATHSFASTSPAYRGWRWAVTVARASRSRVVTVDEVALLPGPDALLPPPWVPWSERLRPGDLGVGDLLPTREDDDRLAPAYASYDPDDPDLDPDLADVVDEIGLGRVRVLSLDGRLDATDRWYYGDAGPDTPMAKAAPGRCASCGFLVRLAGPLRALFGVCANGYAPDDRGVVSLDHGCGAHSEAVVDSAPPDPGPALVDDYRYEVIAVRAPSASGSVDETDGGEPFGHS